MGFRTQFTHHSQLIAAVLTVTTPLLGLALAQQSGARGDAQSQVDALERRAAADRAEINSLRGTNDQLQGTVQEQQGTISGLREQLAMQEGMEPEPTPSDAGQVRHTAEVAFPARSRHVDLDAPASDPLWGRGPEHEGWQGEIGYQYGDLLFTSSEVALLGSQEANYAACSTTNAYANDHIDMRDLEPGHGLCMITTEGRFSAMQVLSLARDDIRLRVTTYEKA